MSDDRTRRTEDVPAMCKGPSSKIQFFPNKNKVSPVLAFNSKDGDVYAFSKDINIFWKHGVRQDIKQLEPRISIILWGWVDMNEKEPKPLNMDQPLITPVGIPEVDEWGKM